MEILLFDCSNIYSKSSWRLIVLSISKNNKNATITLFFLRKSLLSYWTEWPWSKFKGASILLMIDKAFWATNVYFRQRKCNFISNHWDFNSIRKRTFSDFGRIPGRRSFWSLFYLNQTRLYFFFWLYFFTTSLFRHYFCWSI